MKKQEAFLKDYDLHCKRIERSTTININENPEEKERRIKKLEANYGDWFQYYFPDYAKAKCAKFHIKLANRLYKNKVIYQLVNWFRGAAKSVHVNMGVPLYLMVRGELKFMLLIGENEQKACKLLSDIQAQLQYNQRFINDYGQQFNFGNWAEGNFTTKDGVHFHALGLGQSPRGVREQANRPDYIVCDDLDTKERCRNPKRIREAVEWIMEDLWGCFDEGCERFVMANNRIHKNSILANLIKEFDYANAKAKEEGFEPTHHYSRVIAHDENFNPTWPEKYTVLYWRKKKASRPSRSYNREYLDNPVEDGKVFLDDFIQYKDPLPLRLYDALVFYGDLSYKDQGDYKAFALIGKIKREFHVLEIYCRQGSRRNAAIWLYDLYEDKKLSKYNIQYKIEGLFAQDEFVSDFDEEGDERNYYIPVVADKKNKANKFDRIEAKRGFFERRNVWFSNKIKDTPDTADAIDQLKAFEKGSTANDDWPDCMAAGMDELNLATFVSKFEPRIGKRKPLSETY